MVYEKPKLRPIVRKIKHRQHKTACDFILFVALGFSLIKMMTHTHGTNKFACQP